MRLRSRNPDASPLVRAVMVAQARVPNNRPALHVTEDTLAYLVEDTANHKLPLVKRILGAIRAWLLRHGFRLKEIRPEDLVAMARAAVRKVSREGLVQRGSQVAAAYSTLDREITITRVRGNEIEDPSKLTWRNATAWAKSHTRGSHRNNDTGWSIAVSSKGIEEAAHRAKTKADLQAFAALPELIENAVLAGSVADREGRAEIRGIHTFYAPLRIGQEFYRAKLIVRDTNMGNRYYGHRLESLEIEKPNVFGVGREPEGSLGVTRPLGSTIRLSDLFPESKAAGGPIKGPEAPFYSAQDVIQTPAFQRWFAGSKVVDEAGRPLRLVHHGAIEGGVFMNVAEQRRAGIKPRKVLEYGLLGHWFSEHPQEAYGPNRIDAYLPIKHPLYAAAGAGNAQPVTLEELHAVIEAMDRYLPAARARPDP